MSKTIKTKPLTRLQHQYRSIHGQYKGRVTRREEETRVTQTEWTAACTKEWIESVLEEICAFVKILRFSSSSLAYEHSGRLCKLIMSLMSNKTNGPSRASERRIWIKIEIYLHLSNLSSFILRWACRVSKHKTVATQETAAIMGQTRLAKRKMDPCTDQNREINVREEHQDDMEAEETSGFLDEENNSGISSACCILTFHVWLRIKQHA